MNEYIESGDPAGLDRPWYGYKPKEFYKQKKLTKEDIRKVDRLMALVLSFIFIVGLLVTLLR